MPKPTKPRRKPGRPLKLTDEVRHKLVTALKLGSYVQQAVVYAGIGVSTFYEWMQQASDDEQAGLTTPFTELAAAIKKAEADAEVRLLGIVNQAAPANWAAAMTVLERRHPDRWARRERLEHSGPNGAPIEVAQYDLTKLSVDELRQLFTLTRKAAPSEAS